MVIVGLVKKHVTFYDGQQHIQLVKEKVMAHTIDGAGCSFASAIGANLVKGYPLIEAVDLAKHTFMKPLFLGSS